MEVWALEAYGAVRFCRSADAKSDDVAGRSKIYEAIVKGEADFDPGLPESFNVLVRELQSLCLDVELINRRRRLMGPRRGRRRSADYQRGRSEDIFDC